jgi:Ca2+-binding EF-hand superfamily protein
VDECEPLDGGGSVDLQEFIAKCTQRIAEVTGDQALDVGFDCFDVDHKVERSRLTVSNHVLKVSTVSALETGIS